MKKTHYFSAKLPGVTLIEMLVVMALFPLVLVALSWVFVTITEGQLRSVAQSSLDQEHQYIQSRLSADIGQASLVLLPATPGATASALQLQLPQGQVQYTRSNGRLFRADATSSAALNSSRVLVENFSVARLGSPSGVPTVRVSIDIASTVSAQNSLVHRLIDTTYGLRRKP